MLDSGYYYYHVLSYTMIYAFIFIRVYVCVRVSAYALERVDQHHFCLLTVFESCAGETVLYILYASHPFVDGLG